jgi:hypothetical protein
LSHRKTEKERQLAEGRGGKGVGEEPNHTTARKLVPILIIQYSLVLIFQKGIIHDDLSRQTYLILMELAKRMNIEAQSKLLEKFSWNSA